jgi:thioredoxin reductase (NADPH)
VIFERSNTGGQIAIAEKVENYPGVPTIAGHELATNMLDNLMEVGVDLRMGAEVTALRDAEGGWEVEVADEEPLIARAVIICVGSRLVKLGIAGEEEFFGRGVSECATCDGPLMRGRPVVVVGGGDSAFDETITLSQFASQVHLVHRGHEFRAAAVLQQRVANLPNVQVHKDRTVDDIRGETEVTAVVLRDPNGADETVEAHGVFVYIGLRPNLEFLGDIVSRDAAGHIETDPRLSTGRLGLYAAGDIRKYSSRQLVSAAGDGATAAMNALAYLQKEIDQRLVGRAP